MTENRIESVPALSAVRAIPSALAPWRYKRLPQWQRDFRSADSDVAIQRFLKAVGQGERAPLEQGDPAGTGEPMDGTVGQLVPLPLSDYIDAAIYKFSKMNQLARTLTSSSGSLRIPTQTGVSASTWKAEGATVAGTEPALTRSMNLILQKLTSLAVISNEAMEDAFGLAEWLTLDVASQMGEEEDFRFYSGEGFGITSNQPKGLERSSITAATQPDQYYVPTGTQLDTSGGGPPLDAIDFTRPTFIDYAHVQKMFFTLPERVRSSAVWTGNDLVEEAIMNMVEGDGEVSSSIRPLFEMQNIPINTISEGVLDQPTPIIFGRPFVNMPGTLDTSGTPGQNDNRLYFIDMRRSYVILMKDLRVERSALSADAFANDQTQFRFIHRVDGQALEGNPVVPNINTGNFSQSAYIYTGSIKGQGPSNADPSP